MKSIWKFQVPHNYSFSIRMPRGAVILCLKMQKDTPFIWAIVDTEAEIRCRYFSTFGTGHPIDGVGEYIGTYQEGDGEIVSHVFEDSNHVR